MRQGGRAAQLRPAVGVLYLSDAPYRLSYPGDLDILVLRAPVASLGMSKDRLRDLAATPMRTPRRKTLGLLARLVGSSLAGRGLLPSAGETARVSGELLREILIDHAGAPARSRSRAAVRADVRARIQQRFSDPGLRVSELAATAGLSERTIHAAFAEVGSSPAVEVRQARLERSRRLLETTDLPIADIALACGFADPTSYTRAFRREWDVAPMTHRAQAVASSTR